MRPLRKHLSEINLLKMGIPKRFIDKSLDDFHTGGDNELFKIKDYVGNYIENIQENFKENVGLFFYGSNGVGKSMLSSIILKEAYRNRFTFKRCTFVDYITQYTNIWSCKNFDEKEELEELFYHYYKSTDFLCLEEVGKEVDSKINVTILEDLLRYREERGLVTIICTNLHPTDFKELYGNSVYSLVRGNLTPLKIVGVDMRYVKE